ncbi:hypothetical protein AAEH77_00135 [Shewanella xiamenensis]|uniref:hypothetical protein n=1 Tax=Shewanella xiamenensis TaxID=332186 RepID=UPI00313EA0A0
MKRLFLTFGLVIAFFFTAQLSATTIFDNSTYQGPKIDSKNEYECNPNMSSQNLITTSVSACIDYAKSFHSISSSYSWGACEPTSPPATNTQKGISCRRVFNYDGSSTSVSMGIIFGLPPKQSISCPPDNYPNYTFERDTNNDGKTDQCYNPDELDNASNCANQVGSMLPALTNLATRVCKTDSATGASCGYSKKDGDPSYKLDLEMNCFGDGDKVPEYDPEPMPQPETCAKVNDQLMVCKEKPENKCDAMGNCQDQCGFVNKEFYCFIPCSGDDCDKPTPPVNCETNPTAPVCVEEPEPEDPDFCKNNPTDPKCTTPPDGGGDGGSTGGGGSNIDLKPVVDQLKELNDKTDFTTQKNDGRKEFGAFDDLFGESDIAEIKNMTSEKKEEASQLITNIKDEFSGLFKVSSVGGSYEELTLDFSYGSFHSKVWEFFQQNVGIIATAIMALAWLIAASIVMGGRDD